MDLAIVKNARILMSTDGTDKLYIDTGRCCIPVTGVDGGASGGGTDSNGGGMSADMKKLIFTGAVDAEYDGGHEVSVEIPENNVLCVNVYVDSGTAVADKSFDEIVSAANKGFAVFVKRTDGSLMPLFSLSETVATFKAYSVGTFEIITYSTEIKRDSVLNSARTYRTGEFFAVHFSADESGKVSCDMTYNEITSRIRAGQYPIALYSVGICHETFLYEENNAAHIRFKKYIHGNEYQDGYDCFRFVRITLTYTNAIIINSHNNVKAKNPESITFTGATEATYDGSESVVVNIPESAATPNWDSNEGEPGHIENRTHWVERGKGQEETIYNNIQLALNEEIGGFVLLDAPARGFVDGEMLKVTLAGAEFECEAIRYSADGMDVYIIGNAGAIVPDAEINEIPFVILALNQPQDTGDGTMLYGMAIVLFDIEGGEGPTLSIIAKNDLYHKLDYRYVGTKYEQPAWGSEGGVETILDTTLTGDPQEMPIMDKFSLIEGKEYIVHWNGAEYKCAARNVHGEITMTGIGNLGVIEGGTDTGEPFVIVALPGGAADEAGYYGAAIALDGTETVSVKIATEGETVYKIPAKYLDTETFGVQTEEAVYVEDVQLVQLMTKQFVSKAPVAKIPEKGTQCIVTVAGVEYKVTAQEKIRNGETQIVMGRCSSITSDVPLYNDQVPFHIQFLDPPVSYPDYGTFYLDFTWVGDGYIDAPVISIKAPVGMVNTIEQMYLPTSAGVTLKIVSENYLRAINDLSGTGVELLENPKYTTNLPTNVINEAMRTGGFASFVLYTTEDTSPVILFSNKANIYSNPDDYGSVKLNQLVINFDGHTVTIGHGGGIESIT